METYLNRNFKVQGNISCLFIPHDTAENVNIVNIEVQLWHKAPLEIIFLGKGLTDTNGDYIIEFEIDSPVDYIVDGKISDVFIRAFYNGEELVLNSLLQELVAYWKLDGNSIDIVNANNGSDTYVVYSGANGIIKKGAGFNGSTSIISIPYSSSLNSPTTELTLSCWLKIPGAQNSIPLIKYVAALGGDYWLQIFDTSISARTNGGTGIANSLFNLDLDKWYHVTFTWISGVSLALYINGALQETVYSPGPISSADYNFEFSSYPGYAFTGSIDEVGLWGRALDQAEIKRLYNGGSGMQYPFNK